MSEPSIAPESIDSGSPSPSGRSRLLRRAAVLLGVGLLLPFVPLPGLEFTTQSVGATAELPAPAPIEADQLVAAQAAADEPIGFDRVISTAGDVDSFSAIGLTFDAEPSAPVMIRVKDEGGRFGDWRELHMETDDGPDRGSPEDTGSGTEPIWVGDATGYEVSVATADAASAKVVTVHDELQRSVVDATPLAGAAVPPPFGISYRSAWGARAPSSTSYGSTVKLAVVHHSDSSNSYSPAEVPGVLRSVQAFHMDGRGWSDIAYNFVVDKYGGIWEGRAGGIDRSVIGAHSMGFNTNSVGVMVIGDYTAAAPSGAAIESVSKVIGWKLQINGVSPAGRVDFTSGGSTSIPAGQTVNLPRVVGHRDVGSTSCPGSIQGYLGQIRARSQNWADWVRVTSGPIGQVEQIVTGPASMTVVGWAVDLDASGPVQVAVIVDGVVRWYSADGARADVAASYPTAGPNHGFWVDIGGLSPGWHDVCVLAANRGDGQDTSFGCSGAAVPEPSGRSPVGAITSATAFPGGIDVAGWATDPDASSLQVSLLVDGQWRRTETTGAGGRFSARLLGIPSGWRSVCGHGVNQGPGVDLKFGCANVTVPAANPRGGVDTLSTANGLIVASGWAVDDESLDPIVVALDIDGYRSTAWADRRRAGWNSAYPGYGDVHGFAMNVPASKGRHRACLVALNVAGGADSTLACADVVVK